MGSWQGENVVVLVAGADRLVHSAVVVHACAVVMRSPSLGNQAV
jgi:hypothetical protein